MIEHVMKDAVINFADALPDMVLLVDEVGRIRYANASSREIVGYAASEIIGQLVIDLVMQADRDKTRREAKRVLEGGKRLGFENRYRHKQGIDIYLSWSARWLAMDRLRIGVARDVTALRKPPPIVADVAIPAEFLQALAPYERKVLQLLLTEASEKQIAERLGLAASTTHAYITSIFRKLGVRGRIALMSLCLRSLASD
jgi:PAS domain S-box-containing protein